MQCMRVVPPLPSGVLSPFTESEDQVICVKCLVAEYYLCILQDCFESSMVLLHAFIYPYLVHLLYFLTSTAWFVALLSLHSYMVVQAQIQPFKPSVKVSSVFMGPSTSLYSESANENEFGK